MPAGNPPYSTDGAAQTAPQSKRGPPMFERLPKPLRAAQSLLLNKVSDDRAARQSAAAGKAPASSRARFPAGLAAIVAAGAAVVLIVNGCGPSSTPPPPQGLPTDALASCTVSSTTFTGWFQSNMVTVNGVVNPANSVTFPNQPNCSFYQWSEQMFMWLNSP